MYVSSSEQSFGSCHLFVNAASLACLLHPTLVSVNANCRKNKTWLHIVEMNLMRLDLPLTLCTNAAAHPHISSSKNWNVTQKCQSWILSNFSGLKISSSASPCFSDSSHVCIWQHSLVCVCFWFFLLVYCVCVGSSFHCCTFINAFFNLVKISESGFFEKYQKVETQSILHL